MLPYVPRGFNIFRFSFLPVECIYVFCTDLETNRLYLFTNKLRGLSPRANYTDRAAAAGRRS